MTPRDPALLFDAALDADAAALGWRFFTDGVMGGVSRGTAGADLVQGRPALCLRGQVRLENNGGFIQMALPATPPPRPAGAPPWRGLRLAVCGNGMTYGLHLRTAGMTAPWQAWRARFTAPPVWTEVELPWAAFEPYRLGAGARLVPDAIRRVGLLAVGEPMQAELCLGLLAWWG
jgi:hypothetical protein